jgi:hypothetical protein
MHSQYKGFSKEFDSFGANEKKYGTLQQSGTVLIGIEPHPYVRLDGSFKKEFQIDTQNVRSSIQHTYGKINYLNPRFPNGYFLLGKDCLPDYEKNRTQIGANYEFQTLESKIKFGSVVRNDIMELISGNKNRLIEYIINTNLNLPLEISSDLYLRQNNLYANNSKQKNERELRGTFSVDIIPGFYYTSNYNLKSQTFFMNMSKDLSFKHYFYNNLNVAPGRWYSKLAILNFSLGTGNNIDQYINNLPSHFVKPALIFKPLEDVPISSISNSNNYYVTVQFTPIANILIWGKHSFNKTGIAYYNLPNLIPSYIDEIKIEYEPRNWGFFVTSWEQRINKTYPSHTIHNIYFEWSKPWSALLRTKLNNNYRIDITEYGLNGDIENNEFKTNVETLFRFGKNSFITLYLGGMRQGNHFTGINYSIMPGAGCNINIFTFLYVQFDYESRFSIYGSNTHLFSTKITGQF